MLSLTRKAGETIYLDIDEALHSKTVKEVFGKEPIKVVIYKVNRGDVNIGISAPDNITILRGELYRRQKSNTFTLDQ